MEETPLYWPVWYTRGMSGRKNLLHQVRFDRILNAIGDGVTVQDTNGVIIYANRAAAKFVGDVQLIDKKGRPLPHHKHPGFCALRGKSSQRAMIGFLGKGNKDVVCLVLTLRRMSASTSIDRDRACSATMNSSLLMRMMIRMTMLKMMNLTFECREHLPPL